MAISDDRQWPKNTALWAMGSSARKAVSARIRRRYTKRLLASGRLFRVLILVGQKRSGNHVFLNWYMSQCEGVCLLFNNVAPDQIPTERRRQEMRLNKGFGQVPPTLIFSYEDHTPEAVFAGPLQNFLDDHADQISATVFAMVMRDPRNLIASRIKKWPEEFDDPTRLDIVRGRYLETAQAILEPQNNMYGQPFVSVLYNALISSASYRDRLTKALGIRKGARGLDQVANYGHGSSFEGQDKSGRAHEMNVFDRWQKFEDDPRFQTVFADEDMSALIATFDSSLAEMIRP